MQSKHLAERIGMPFLGHFDPGIDVNQDPLALLRSIQQIESPEQLDRFLCLVDQGMSADEIAPLCDEMGRIRYDGLDDPDALSVRLRGRLVNTDDLNHIFDPLPAGESFYDEHFYRPGIAVIRQLRPLVAMALEHQAEIPSLRSDQDYMDYLDQFSLPTVMGLFANTGFFEITQGCDGYCRDICSIPLSGRVQHHIPYETLVNIFARFRHPLSEASPSLYYGSDLKYYCSGDVDGADVLSRFHFYTGNSSFVSTAFGLDSTTIRFLHRVLIDVGEPLQRISGLKLADDPILLERLIAKLELYGGQALSLSNKAVLRAAFNLGKKSDFNQTAGYAVRSDTAERNITLVQVPCIQGVLFRAGEGFVATVQRPPSHLFPFGQLLWPILPRVNNRVPMLARSFRQAVPYAIGTRSDLLFAPDLIQVDFKRSHCLSDDRSGSQVRNNAVGAYRERLIFTVQQIYALLPDPSDLDFFATIQASIASATDPVLLELAERFHRYALAWLSELESAFIAKTDIQTQYPGNIELLSQLQFYDNYCRPELEGVFHIIFKILPALSDRGEYLEATMDSERYAQLKRMLHQVCDQMERVWTLALASAERHDAVNDALAQMQASLITEHHGRFGKVMEPWSLLPLLMDLPRYDEDAADEAKTP